MSKRKSSQAAVTAVVIGAGNRGYGYSHYIRVAPEDLQVVQLYIIVFPLSIHGENPKNPLSELCEKENNLCKLLIC